MLTTGPGGQTARVPACESSTDLVIVDIRKDPPHTQHARTHVSFHFGDQGHHKHYGANASND